MKFEQQWDEMMKQVKERASRDEAFQALCESDFAQAVKEATGIKVPAGLFPAAAKPEVLSANMLLGASGATSKSSSGLRAVGVGQSDLSSMDIEAALVMVQQQRAQQLDDTLKNQVADVEARNKQIAQLNQQLSALNSQPQSEETNRQIEDLKAQIDQLSTANQMAMLQLQSMTNKRTEAVETMSAFTKKMQDSRTSIIGNLR